MDTTLPFGLKSVPKIFMALADTLEWIVKEKGIDWLIHFIDDYLFMGEAGSEECARHLAISIQWYRT